MTERDPENDRLPTDAPPPPLLLLPAPRRRSSEISKFLFLLNTSVTEFRIEAIIK